MAFTQEFLHARFAETFENNTDVFSISLARGGWTNASASSQELLLSSECFNQRAGISGITKEWDTTFFQLRVEFLSSIFQAPIATDIIFDRALLWRNGGIGNQWLTASIAGQNVTLPAGHGLSVGSKVYVPEPISPAGLYFVKTLAGDVATLSATATGQALAFSGGTSAQLKKYSGLICGGFRLGTTFIIPRNTSSVLKLAGTSYGS